MRLEVDGTVIEVDNEGYLLDPSQWDAGVGLALAEREGITMTAAHWEVVQFVRDHFENWQSVPEHRTLLKALRERHGKETATRKYVFGMFPYGYGQQACKIAGMRKPLKLVLDL